MNPERLKLQVVILEDHPYERKGMEDELNSENDIEVVGASGEPGQIFETAKQHQPDVAVIDIRIYDDYEVGPAAIAALKQTLPEIKCVVVTAFPELENFLPAFDAGAEAFVKKASRQPRPSLPDLVRLVAKGGRYYDPDIVDELRRYLHVTRVPSRVEHVTREENPLTPREREVLAQLAEGHTNPQIADNLVISVNTVKAHIASIKRKVDALHRHEIPLLAVAKGWLPNAPRDID
ncbi:MAG: LuxR C-terminal-related transcriptional regulator [Promethearchaeota archaeon]